MNPQRDYSPISHGREVRSLRLEGFALTDAIYDARATVPDHRHECASLTFVLKGDVRESVERREQTLSIDRMLLKPPGASHSNAFGVHGARLLLLEVFNCRLESAGPSRRVFEEVRQLPSPGVRPQLVRAMQEMRRNDDYSPLCVEGIMVELLGTLGRTRDGSASAMVPSYVRDVRDRLHDDFRTPIRISDLAREAGVEASHLSRRFRAAYGRGIGEYVRDVRLDWAMRALEHTRDPIASIALAAGFSDQSHFTRELKSATGMTPADYRRTRA
jgi:AraC family transcriptional regulator